MKNYIGISRDHSVSMRPISKAAARDYNDNISAIKDAAQRENQDTIVSVVKCGVGIQGRVDRDIVNSNISALKPLPESGYEISGHSTPLWDSVGDLIELLESVPDAKEKDVSFLIMVITDGEENSSRKWNITSLSRKMRELQSTDRWTFVFRVPRGGKRGLVQAGIPDGNILEWEQTTQGMEVATRATVSAVSAYYQDRSKGLTSTRSFYTTDMSQVNPAELKKKLVDISKQVNRYPVNNTDVIKDFVERVTSRPFVKGTAFYQLTKTEKEVQDYKKLIVRDRMTGAAYTGSEARQILGLPEYGTVKIVPGNHGQYDIFIQSTSLNRKLLPGTEVVIWTAA